MLKGKTERREGGPVISIIGPGMKVHGDLTSEGTIRIEGDVTGAVEAGKAVVVGRGGRIEGDVTTEDAVISGVVHGELVVRSRLEVQATARIEGEIRTARFQFEEGAVLNGSVEMLDGASEDASQAKDGTDPAEADRAPGFPEPAAVGEG